MQLNTVAINIGAVEKFTSDEIVRDGIINNCNNNLVVVGFDKQISTVKKALGKDAKIYQFWTRENGLNLSLFK